MTTKRRIENEAVRRIACPTCPARAWEACMTPRAFASRPHAARIREYDALISFH